MVSEDSGLRQSFLLIVCTDALSLRGARVASDTQVSQHIAKFVSERHRSEAATVLRPPFTGASVQSFATPFGEANLSL